MSSSIHFPDEIVYNIFVRLPVKDIIRLTCVCKAWRDLVTHPDFISTHLNLQTDSNKCLVQCRGIGKKHFLSVVEDRDFAEHSNLEVPFTCETRCPRLVGSVNGLVCLNDAGRTMYLWNPSIWKLKILRASCFRRNFPRKRNIFTLGFGFHDRTNDYKIVRMVYTQYVYRSNFEETQVKTEVFSLARNSWRKVEAKAGSFAEQLCSTLVVNDCVHWTAVRIKDESTFVLAFDFAFASDKFEEITLPDYFDDGDGYQSDDFEPSLSVEMLTESLALVVSYSKTRHTIECCIIWVMKEYGKVESWSKQYSFVPNKICYRCLRIVNDRDLILYSYYRRGVISYDFDEQEYKPLEFAYPIDSLAAFRESLVLYKEGIRLTPRKNLLVEGGIHLGKRKRSVFMLLQLKGERQRANQGGRICSDFICTCLRTNFFVSVMIKYKSKPLNS